MMMLLIPAMIVALIIQCCAAYRKNEPKRNKARVILLALQFALALCIVPSGLSFTEAVSWWLEWWSIPIILPFVFFLAGGILISWSEKHALFLLGYSCFAIGSVFRCSMYFSIAYSFSPFAAVIFGSLFLALLAMLFARLKCPFGVSKIVLFLCALCVSANSALAGLEAFRWIQFGNSSFFAEVVLSFLLHPHLICPILLLVAGFLRAKSVLVGESAPKQELAASLCFGISQILLIFGDCAMAAASV